jgi:hypothetical protein
MRPWELARDQGHTNAADIHKHAAELAAIPPDIILAHAMAALARNRVG